MALTMLVTASCGRTHLPPAPEQARVEAIYATCLDDMARSVCVAKGNGGGAPSGASGEVFVAGSGKVDPQSYRQFREAGDAMCSLVRQSCLASWEAARCVTARALWGTPSQKGLRQ